MPGHPGERLAGMQRSGPVGALLHRGLKAIWVAGRQAMERRRARAVLRGLRGVSAMDLHELYAWFRRRGSPAVPAPPSPVTVVITCHDDGSILLELLGSLRQQSLQPFPVVIVDDASRDPTTLGVLKELEANQGEWGRVLRLKRNVGLPAARNQGLSLVSTPFAVCVDADDLLGPDFLRRTVARLEQRSDLGFVYFDYYMFGAREEHVRTPEFDLEFLLRTNYIVASAPFRVTAWRSVGGYHEKMVEGYEDWEFWLRLAEAGWQAERIPETLFYYRRSSASMIARLAVKHNEWVRFIRQEHPELPWPPAADDADLGRDNSSREPSRDSAGGCGEG